MAITKNQITEALHCGVRTASKNWCEWSDGQALAEAPEYLIVVEIARNIRKKLGESECLRLEMKYADVLSGADFVPSRGAPLKSIKGGKRADVVLLKNRVKPTCVIEVKKNPTYKGLQDDLRRLAPLSHTFRLLFCGKTHGFRRHTVAVIGARRLKRLRDVVYTCRHRKGVLKHGFLSIYKSAKDEDHGVDTKDVVQTISKFFGSNGDKARAKRPNITTWERGKEASIVVEVYPAK